MHHTMIWTGLISLQMLFIPLLVLGVGGMENGCAAFVQINYSQHTLNVWCVGRSPTDLSLTPVVKVILIDQ